MKIIKTILFYLVIFAFIAICLGNQTTSYPGKDESQNTLFEKLDLFASVLSLIQNSYVQEVSSKELIYGALKGMLSSLDPFSQFLTPDLYSDIQIDTGGHFGGLGMEVIVKDNFLVVVAPIPGTPAAHAGIKPGDKIIKINGEMMDAPILDDVLKKLRGPVGSKVEITIYRQETQQYITLELTREQINIQSVTKSEIIKDTSIGYIRLSKFKEKTASEVSDALKELEKQNIKGLILDLRNNTGGLLDESIKLAGLFVGPEKLVVYTKGRLPEQNLNKYSDKTYARINYPLAVLINGGSASASEVVAGAIQDHKTGTIIGENSFGKASVQSLIPLKDGSALRLTTAWYYTPNGRLIHNKGIEPDIKVNLTKEDLNIIIQKLNQVNIGELSVNDPLYVDNQVQWAIDFLKKCEQDNIQETTSK